MCWMYCEWGTSVIYSIKIEPLAETWDMGYLKQGGKKNAFAVYILARFILPESCECKNLIVSNHTLSNVGLDWIDIWACDHDEKFRIHVFLTSELTMQAHISVVLIQCHQKLAWTRNGGLPGENKTKQKIYVKHWGREIGSEHKIELSIRACLVHVAFTWFTYLFSPLSIYANCA